MSNYFKNVAFDFYTTLISSSDDISFQTGSSIALGDATFSIDGSAFANLGTTPTVTPAGAGQMQVKISVSAVENTGTGGQGILRDVAGDQWNPVSFSWTNDRTVLDSGTLQTGTSTTATLRSSASAVNDLYNYGILEIIEGTGAGQSRQITDYVGSTKVATIPDAWATIPDNTSVYLIHPGVRVPTLAEINVEADTALTDYDAPTYAELVQEIDDVQDDIAALNVVPASSLSGVVSSGDITVVRGTTWEFTRTIGNVSIYDTVYFTVKVDETQPDSEALLQVYNGASGTSGLLVFNGAAPLSTGNGILTINNAVTGNVTVTVQVAETVGSPEGEGYYYDYKGIDNNGPKNVKASGRFTVTPDITRATSSPP